MQLSDSFKSPLKSSSIQQLLQTRLKARWLVVSRASAHRHPINYPTS